MRVGGGGVEKGWKWRAVLLRVTTLRCGAQRRVETAGWEWSGSREGGGRATQGRTWGKQGEGRKVERTKEGERWADGAAAAKAATTYY